MSRSGYQGFQVSRREAMLMAAAGVAAVAQPSRAADSVGAVTDLRGLAFAEVGQGTRPLAPAAPLFLDEFLRTGDDSRLAMRLGSRTTVKLGAGAKLRIDRYLVDAGGVIDLAAGAMLFSGAAGGHPKGLSVRSPFGLIAVRGTSFFAGPSNGVFGVFVERGEVRVSGGGRRVTVRAGQGTDVAGIGAAPSEPKAWGAPRIAAALASVS
jgi:ferric-dicitrate binding protein FerR (iron transport regulator)